MWRRSGSSFRVGNGYREYRERDCDRIGLKIRYIAPKCPVLRSLLSLKRHQERSREIKLGHSFQNYLAESFTYPVPTPTNGCSLTRLKVVSKLAEIFLERFQGENFRCRVAAGDSFADTVGEFRKSL